MWDSRIKCTLFASRIRQLLETSKVKSTTNYKFNLNANPSNLMGITLGMKILNSSIFLMEAHYKFWWGKWRRKISPSIIWLKKLRDLFIKVQTLVAVRESGQVLLRLLNVKIMRVMPIKKMYVSITDLAHLNLGGCFFQDYAPYAPRKLNEYPISAITKQPSS